MYAYELAVNPVMFGLERLNPYALYTARRPAWKDGEGVCGVLVQHGDYRRYTAEDLCSKPSVCVPSTKSLPQTPNYTARLYKSPENPLQDWGTQPRAMLFVGNHVMLGVDMMLLQWCITAWMNVYMRGLAHRGTVHYCVLLSSLVLCHLFVCVVLFE